MKKSFLILFLAVIVLGTTFSGEIVALGDVVFSAPVEGEVLGQRGRFRTRHGVTRFRQRGRVRAGYGSSCAGRDFGGCDQGNDRGGCDSGFRLFQGFSGCDGDTGSCSSSRLRRW